ncbi:mechanosensitive ion channel family protein [Rhodoferax sp. U11-2br]|uniref:mechanosensitive ion channel family protein n=1 Tax=Rhodoferax sp. U11-2br TaxID=2838878 RepID=UPI001BE8DC72|nr:mechanosensitive ion channel family protein [Rhodoferax sp. U11-2br]
MRALLLFLLLVFGVALSSHAQTAASASDTNLASSAATAESTLRFFNRDITTLRGSLYGVSAPDRVRRAQVRIQELLSQPGPHVVTQKPETAGVMVQIDGATAFFVTPDDINQLEQDTLAQQAQRSATALQQAIAASHESRTLDAILHSAGLTALATLVAGVLVWLLGRVRRVVAHGLAAVLQKQADRLQLGGVQLLHPSRVVGAAQAVLTGTYRLLLFVVGYEWLSFVLARFPYTHRWGELLNSFLWDLVGGMGAAVVSALPGLLTAVVIFYLTRIGTKALDALFRRIAEGELQVTWLDAAVAEPTRRIVKIVVWLFALAMAYPYLPGAQTEAFKGLSVLLGLMISLGASNLVGQVASGLILTYGRVYRQGEYVAIGGHEGTITELGMFFTRIRTGMGEELTLSNSAVLNDTTRNYSRAVRGQGFALDTQVTIGYDTPWRQVHAMLIEAALHTPGVLAEPAPQVFQTALGDWYPQYRLVCQAIPSEPRPRAMVMSALHANIQDVFNTYGVQIMSPQYFEDPASPKIVPPDQWFAAPAKPPEKP